MYHLQYGLLIEKRPKKKIALHLTSHNISQEHSTRVEFKQLRSQNQYRKDNKREATLVSRHVDRRHRANHIDPPRRTNTTE